MERNELIYADRIKQECCTEGERDEKDNDSTNIKINEIYKYELQYDVIEIKQEEEEAINPLHIKAETCTDREDEPDETSFNNCMNTEDNIKHEHDDISGSLKIEKETCPNEETCCNLINNDTAIGNSIKGQNNKVRASHF